MYGDKITKSMKATIDETIEGGKFKMLTIKNIILFQKPSQKLKKVY